MTSVIVVDSVYAIYTVGHTMKMIIGAPFCIISPYETTSSLVNHPVDENMCKIFFDIHTFSFSAFYLRFDHIYLIFP